MRNINEEIKKMWPTHPIGEIAKVVGLTYLAVQHRGHRMGLPRKKRGAPPKAIPIGMSKLPLCLCPGHFASDQRSYDILLETLRHGHH